MKIKLDLYRNALVVKLFISTIFLLSAIAKLIDPHTAILNLLQLLPITSAIAKAIIFTIIMLEAGFAILIWWWIHKIFLAIPIAFWGMLLFSYLRGTDCGCFGSLPILRQISLSSHFLLLTGLFLGLYYLVALKETNSETIVETDKLPKPGSLKWLGIAATTLMLAAFIPLPFSPAKNQASTLDTGITVNREYVEAALSYRNVIIIDARSQSAFQNGHIADTINIPYNSDDIMAPIEKYNLRNQPVIVYCSNSRCNMAHLLYKKLWNLDCKNAKIYTGGWEDWQHYSN